MPKVNIINKTSTLARLSDSQILEKLTDMESNVESFYVKELRQLEKQKAKAIIKDLNKFKELQKKYYTLKSISPDAWLEHWDVYKSILNEAKKRKIIIKNAIQ
jgi:hypothetical protein